MKALRKYTRARDRAAARSRSIGPFTTNQSGASRPALGSAAPQAEERLRRTAVCEIPGTGARDHHRISARDPCLVLTEDFPHQALDAIAHDSSTDTPTHGNAE